MKPRNFITNVLLMLIFIAEIILVVVAKSIDWKVIFVGVVGVILLVPDFFIKPKHRALYLVYKSFSQLGVVLLIIASAFLGFIFHLAFGLAEGFAQGCGGSVSHTELDKFVAYYLMYLFVPLLAKLVMNIIDFAVYKKDLKSLKQEN